MSDDALIRRENLKRLMAQRGWSVKDLSRELGWGRYSFWNDLVDGRKSFGEKLARRIEDAAKLPRGWLDQHAAHHIVPADTAAASAPAANALVLSAEEHDLLFAFRKLPVTERQEIVRDVMGSAERLEEMVSRYLRENHAVSGFASASRVAERISPAPPAPPSSGAMVPSPQRAGSDKAEPGRRGSMVTTPARRSTRKAG